MGCGYQRGGTIPALRSDGMTQPVVSECGGDAACPRAEVGNRGEPLSSEGVGVTPH